MRTRGREVVLTVGAIVGLLCVLVALASVVLGLRPLVFRSGSMAPTIGTGALGLSQGVAADELRVGDVVTVPTGSGDLVTHRIVQVTHSPGTATLQLQGDANSNPDPRLYPVTEAGRVVVTVPRLGYVVGWLTSPVGMLLLGLYAAFLASVVLRGRHGDDPPPPRVGRRRATPVGAGRHAGRVLTMAVVGGAALVPAPAVAAPWTDSVGVSGTTLSAGSVAAPGNFRCSALGVLSVTFAWDAVPGATNYTLHYGPGGATTKTVAGLSDTITTAITGGQAWVVANRAFGLTTWSSVNSNTRTYSVLAVSVCS